MQFAITFVSNNCTKVVTKYLPMRTHFDILYLVNTQERIPNDRRQQRTNKLS